VVLLLAAQGQWPWAGPGSKGFASPRGFCQPCVRGQMADIVRLDFNGSEP
jgi:hypothetical protein